MALSTRYKLPGTITEVLTGEAAEMEVGVGRTR
jgi:hypothetical protein